jgi:hypothetical protein
MPDHPRSRGKGQADLIWANRGWGLLEAWENVPPDAWTAPGLRPADGDAARTAIVEQSRAASGTPTIT